MCPCGRWVVWVGLLLGTRLVRGEIRLALLRGRAGGRLLAVLLPATLVHGDVIRVALRMVGLVLEVDDGHGAFSFLVERYCSCGVDYMGLTWKSTRFHPLSQTHPRPCIRFFHR